MQDIVRVGYISSVDPDTGMARVYYPDRDCTTAELPLFSGWGEEALPEVNDQVLVVHLSNDTSSGVILGKFYNQEERPGPGRDYYKQMGKSAFLSVEGGQLMVLADGVVLRDGSGMVSVSELIELERRVAALERAGDP